MVSAVPTGTTACPAADVLSAFTAGELTEAEAAALEAHLDGCSSCLVVVGCLAQSPELAAGSVVGRYQILARVGRGAFGVVYAAYDPELDRKVALKILHRSRRDDEERFQHEARAMARVSSPHVVAVHDVGRSDSGWFAAMEFIDGCTLGAWLGAEPRSVREIVGAFAQAGRGLAAAHAAGIIHRDFKPDNVLVHRSGRVAVTDFGLARSDLIAAPVADAGNSSPAMSSITVEGTLVGTPLYMSPEALRREPVDARSDLFSFSVALYSALFAAPPFPARTVPALLAAIEAGPRAPREPRIPRHVRDAVLSGLRADPARRPPTMHALVDALEHDPRRSRIAAVAVGGVGLAFAIARVASPSAPAPARESCGDRADALVDAVWGADRRLALRAGIEGASTAIGGAGRVERALDRYAMSWKAGWTDACSAEESQLQPALVVTHRFACLERRRDQWRSLVATLEHPDAAAIAGASTAAYALPRVEACADERMLGGSWSARDDVQQAAAYVSIARAQVLADLGSTSAGLTALTSPLALARSTGDRALEAEALIVEGDLRRAVDPPAAEAPLHAAAVSASAAGRLDLEARAKVLIVETLAHSQLRLAEVQLAADYAEAAVMRLGDPVLVAEYYYARSLAEWSAGGAERSIWLELVTLLANLIVRGAEHPKVAEAQNSVAVSLVELEWVDAGLPLARAALAMRERLQGTDHPEALNARGNLAFALAELGQIAEAVQLQEAVAARRAAQLGPDYFLLSETWIRLSRLYQWELGRTADALQAARRARAIDEKEFGAESAEGIASLANLARILAAQGELGAADHASRRALEIADAHLPADHLLVRSTLATRGYVLEQAARCTEAMPILDRLDAASTTRISGRGELVFGLHARARCELRRGDLARAATVLERALAIREQSRGPTSPMIADALIELARFDRTTGRWTGAIAAATRAVEVRAGVPGTILAQARAELAAAHDHRRR